jgi:hypothetical protein
MSNARECVEVVRSETPPFNAAQDTTSGQDRTLPNALLDMRGVAAGPAKSVWDTEGPRPAMGEPDRAQ